MSVFSGTGLCGLAWISGCVWFVTLLCVNVLSLVISDGVYLAVKRSLKFESP